MKGGGSGPANFALVNYYLYKGRDCKGFFFKNNYTLKLCIVYSLYLLLIIAHKAHNLSSQVYYMFTLFTFCPEMGSKNDQY